MRNKFFIWGFWGLLFLVGAVLGLLLTLAKLNLPFDKQVEITISVTANVIGICLAALLGYKFATKQADSNREKETERQRIANTFLMSAEWESESMFKARCDADKTFVQALERRKISLKAAYEKHPVEATMPLFRVIHFFHRLDCMRKSDQLNEPLAISLFGNDYLWWWNYYFENQIKVITEEGIESEYYIPKLDWLLDASLTKLLLSHQAAVNIPTIAKSFSSEELILHSQ